MESKIKKAAIEVAIELSAAEAAKKMIDILSTEEKEKIEKAFKLSGFNKRCDPYWAFKAGWLACKAFYADKSQPNKGD